MDLAEKLLLATGGLFTGMVSLLGYVARLVFTGKLVPRSTLVDVIERHKEQLIREKEISNFHQQNSEDVTKALQSNIAVLDRLVEEQRVVKDFILSMRYAAEQSRRELPKGDSVV